MKFFALIGVDVEMHKSRTRSARLIPASIVIGLSLLSFGATAEEPRHGSLASACDEKPDAWKVSGKLIGKPTKKSDRDATGREKYETSRDVSGMACATTDGFPRLCLIVDDETQGAQVIVLKDRKMKDGKWEPGKLEAGEFIPLNNDTDDEGKPLELDAEAVAYAKDGEHSYFYVVGSHGRARHEDKASAEARNEAKAKASRQLFRIDAASIDPKTGKIAGYPEKPDRIPTVKLSKILEKDDSIGKYYNKALCENGLTIEGLAARWDSLFVGMRGPVLAESKALILEVPISALFGTNPGKALSLHEVVLGTDRSGKARGIRDLVPHGDGFLIIAGPVNDPLDDRVRDGDYAIYSWTKKGPPTERLSLESYGIATKPEVLVPLDEKDGKLRALLLFDGPEEGAPRTIEFPMP